MRKFTLAAATVAMMLGTSGYAQNTAGVQPIAKRAMSILTKRLTLRASDKADATQWLPGTETSYSCKNADDPEWEKSATSTYTYNNVGKVLTKITKYETGTTATYNKEENTYDSLGRLAKTVLSVSADGENYTAMTRTVNTYDGTTNFITETDAEQYDTATGKWEKSQLCVKNDIERNADGNITSVTTWTVNDNKEWEIENKVVFEYTAGKTGPTKCTETVYDDGKEGGTIVASDIVWEKCDGQLFTGVDGEWATGNNIVKSAKVSMYMEELGMNINADLTNTVSDNGDYDIKVTAKAMTAKIVIAMTRNTTDANGSYKSGQYLYASTLGFGDICNQKNLVSVEYTEVTKDSRGNTTFMGNYIYGDDDDSGIFGASAANGSDAETKWRLLESTKNEYTYGGEHGEITEKIVTMSTEQETMKTRHTYGDFIGISPTAVNNVETVGNTKAEYFTLDGTRVDAPTGKGIYIMKTGNRTVKIAR